ncbi:MAG: RNA polymerase sigma-70 factor [Balneolales bacterium]
MIKYHDNIELWIEDIREGDKYAFEKLYLKFYSPLCKFAWRFLRSSHISEELVQDVFLNIWESRASLDPDKNITSFLYKDVRNKVLNHLKHQNIVKEYNPEIEWLNPAAVTQLHDFDGNDVFIKTVKKAIENIPEYARQIYKLNRKDGLTYREISEVLDISPKTVEAQMSKALKSLRRDLFQYGTKIV